MSRYHTDEFYVDMCLLRDHISRLRERRKTAGRLYANVREMRKYSSPDDAYKYNSLLRDIERMIAYFEKMEKVLCSAADEAEYLSRKVGHMIEEDTFRSRRVVKNTFML